MQSCRYMVQKVIDGFVDIGLPNDMIIFDHQNTIYLFFQDIVYKTCDYSVNGRGLWGKQSRAEAFTKAFMDRPQSTVHITPKANGVVVARVQREPPVGQFRTFDPISNQGGLAKPGRSRDQGKGRSTFETRI